MRVKSYKFILLVSIFANVRAANLFTDLQIELLSLVDALNKLSKSIIPIVSPVPGVPALLTESWLKQGNVWQLSVLEQGLNADCGYHALKNAILLLNAFRAGSNGQLRDVYLGLLKDKTLYDTWHTDWYNSLLAMKHQTEWLSDAEIEYLNKIKNDQKPFNGIPFEHNVDQITVIGSPAWIANFDPEKGRSYEEKIIKLLNDFINKKDFYHVCIVANAGEYQTPEGKILTKKDHWISVGINKVGGIAQFIVLDSSNNVDRLNSQIVVGLVDKLTNMDQIGLEIEGSEIVYDIGSMQNLLDVIKGLNPSYKGGSLAAFEGLIDKYDAIMQLAKKNGWDNQKSFERYKKQADSIKNEAQQLLIKDKVDSFQKTVDDLKLKLASKPKDSDDLLNSIIDQAQNIFILADNFAGSNLSSYRPQMNEALRMLNNIMLNNADLFVDFDSKRSKIQRMIDQN